MTMFMCHCGEVHDPGDGTCGALECGGRDLRAIFEQARAAKKGGRR